MSSPRNSYILKKVSRRFLAWTAVCVFSSQAFTFLTPFLAGNFLGENAISATTLLLPLMELQYVFIYLLAAGSSYLAAELFGSNRRKEAGKHFTVSLISVSTAMMLLSVAIWLSGGVLTDYLSSGNAGLKPLLDEYLRAMCLLFFPLGIFYTLDYFVLAEGNSNFSAICNSASLITNLISCVLLLLFTGLGIASLAYSSIIGSVVGIVMNLWYMQNKSSIKVVGVRGEFLAILSEDVKKGLPLMTSDLLFVLLLAGINLLVLNNTEESGPVIWGVVCSLIGFAVCIMGTLTESSNILCEHFHGARDYRGQKQIIAICDKIGYFALFAILVIVELFPTFVLGCFNVSDEVALTMKNAFRLAAPVIAVKLIGAYESSIYYFLHHSKQYLASISVQYIGIIVIIFIAAKWNQNLIWLSFTIVAVLDLLFTHSAKRKLDAELIGLSDDLICYETSLPYKYESIGPVLASVCGFLKENNISNGDVKAVEHCVDELCYNIIKHVNVKFIRKSFDLRCVVSDGMLTVTFFFSGLKFNPIKVFSDTADKAVESGCKGMLALRIFNHYAFSPCYTYLQGINMVSMTKTI